MNTCQLRELRIRASIGYAIQPEPLVALVETLEDVLEEVSVADSEMVQDEIRELKKSVADLTSEIEEYKGEIDHLKENHQAEIERLNERIEEATASTDQSTRVEDLTADLERTTKELEESRARIAELENEGTTFTVARLAGHLLAQSEASHRDAQEMRARVKELGEVRLNGASVIYRDGVAFIPLPRALWTGLRAGDERPCRCGKCDGDNAWDTLAISLRPTAKGRTNTAWTVHMPEARR